LSLAKAFSKFAACSCHVGSLINGASGETFGSGIPARKRATSSGDEPPDWTGPRTRAAGAGAGAAAVGLGVLLCHGHCIAELLETTTKMDNATIVPAANFLIGQH
jgi:hypothetical protein